MKIAIMTLVATGILSGYAQAGFGTQELACSDGAYSFKSAFGPLSTLGAIELNGNSIPGGVLNCGLFQNPDETGNSCHSGDDNCFVGAPHSAPSLPMFCSSLNGQIIVNAGMGSDGLGAEIYSQPGNDLTRTLVAQLKCEIIELQ